MKNTITINSEANDVLQEMMQYLDSDTNIPRTFSEAEVVHYALLIMREVNTLPAHSTVRDAAMLATLKLEATLRS